MILNPRNCEETMTRDNLAGIFCVVLVMVASGSIWAGVTEELPEWWPSEVPVVEGASISRIDHAESKGLPSVRFNIPIEDWSTESLVDFYRTRLEAQEWSLGDVRDTGMTRSVTATKQSIDKRVIVTVKKPGTIFNRQRDAFLLEVIVYRSIPTS
jgi:hypothetical protein